MEAAGVKYDEGAISVALSQSALHLKRLHALKNILLILINAHCTLESRGLLINCSKSYINVI